MQWILSLIHITTLTSERKKLGSRKIKEVLKEKLLIQSAICNEAIYDLLFRLLYGSEIENVSAPGV
jgi:hypothetical protein